MSHFSSTDESCKHGKDEAGRESEGSEDDESGEGDGRREECEDGTCFEMERGELALRDKEGKPVRSREALFAAAKSRWHDTMEVPITTTDLSVLLMMRRSSSSLLPG
jgi:hypothetical protein